MDSIKAPALLAGRILLSILFITSGWGKIVGYAGTVGYIAGHGPCRPFCCRWSS